MPQTKGKESKKKVLFYFFFVNKQWKTIFEGEQDGHETDPGGLNEMRNL